MRCIRHLIETATAPGIGLVDLTPELRERVSGSGVRNGFITVTSRHTTTAVTINENEPRLLEDVKSFFGRLAPPSDDYLHNDIHLRECPPDEPENAHAHLLAMLVGSSEVIPIVEGTLDLGTWQSVFLVELDGPRQRTVNLQIIGE